MAVFGSDARVNATFTATDKATPVIKALRTNVSALGSKTGGPLGGLLSGLGGLNLSMIGATAAGVGFVGMLGDAVKAATEEDIGIAQLNASLKANVPNWQAHTDAVNAAVDAAEKLAFTDDSARQSLALLLPTTHDVGKAVELMNIAMNLARLRGTDLAETTTLVGKVYQGNLTSLKRFGISLKGVSNSTEALAKIQEIAAGQAQAYADTTAGHYEQIKIKINDLKEDIGHGLQPVIDEALTGITNLFEGKAAANGPLQGLIDQNNKASASMQNFNAAASALGVDLTQIPKDANEFTNWMLQVGQAFLQNNGDAEVAALMLSKYATSLGVTTDQLKNYVISAQASGLSAQDMVKQLQDLSREQALHNRMLEQQSSNAEAASASANRLTAAQARYDARLKALNGPLVNSEQALSNYEAAWRGAAVNIPRTIEGMAADTHRAFRSMLKQDKADLKALIDDLNHDPADSKNLMKWLPRAMREAHNALMRAEKRGDAAAIAEAASLVARLNAQWAALHAPATITVAINGGGSGRTGSRVRAGGGPVYANDTYVVGENGPEVLHMGGSGGGFVTQGRGAGGTSEIHTHVYLDGSEIAHAVDRRFGLGWTTAGNSATRN